MKFTGFFDETRVALGSMADAATGIVSPRVRLGVTGLSRAGKTVFITALVHNLLHGGRLPLFNASAEGRITRAYLEPQPDDDLPRFAYEDHIEALIGPDRHWPQSTRRMSQLRLTIEYQAEGLMARNIHGGRLHVDIVDYPGEWLLDLPLLDQSYAEWSQATLAAAESPSRRAHAADWRKHLATIDATAPADEAVARKAAQLFTAFLAGSRDANIQPSTLAPGRFLMPGDLEGSPLLTFAPLDVPTDGKAPDGSIWAMMERRYNSYVERVVKPFFFDHFARLDRQIVLIDVLSALNAGPDAIADMRDALGQVLSCFRLGASGWLSALFARKIDRILFAATKADMLHHESHDRLENIMGEIVSDASGRAEIAGARIDVAALAAIRATREATVRHDGEILPCIAGIPEAGEIIGETKFDGTSEAAIFPGDLPKAAATAFDGSMTDALHFVRFRPPEPAEARALQQHGSFPHIRLDRTLEFLLGDQFS
jgi:predicted YcjX-like family ATPase